ncbi:MAG: hypothetical protein JSU85_01740 [Candidatus Zixiibacteriota bacterium]|nr:MAG: hypothetical protein JSU85_01740 [candidate division Zixibacteria bacterium]
MVSYESSTDRSNERAVADLVGRYLGQKLKQMPEYSPADFVSVDKSAYVEIRCRNCRRDKYSKFLISSRKWTELLNLKIEKANPSIYLAVAWTDCVGLLEIDFGKIELVSFQRNKSEGTSKDDIMLAIPVSKFQMISDKVRLKKSRNWITASSGGD